VCDAEDAADELKVACADARCDPDEVTLARTEIDATLAEAVRDVAPLGDIVGENDLDRDDEDVRDSKSEVDGEPVADLEREGLAVYDALGDEVTSAVTEGVDRSEMETVAAADTV
jgi:hypothetical protein